MVERKLWWMSPGNLPDWQPLENLTFGVLAAGVKVSPRPEPSLPELTDPVQSLRNTSGRDGAQGHGFLRREPESCSGSMSSYPLIRDEQARDSRAPACATHARGAEE